MEQRSNRFNVPARFWDIILIGLFILFIPLVLGNSYLLHVINLIGIYSIVVIGLDLLIGLTGLISLGSALFFALGGYISGYLTVNHSVSPFFSLLLSCLGVGIFSTLIGMPLIRLKGFYLALGTLGMGIIGFTLINGGGTLTGGPNGMSGIPHFSLYSLEFDSETSNFYLIWLTLFLSYLFAKFLSDSRTGRALKSIHSDEQTAIMYGVEANHYKLKIFVLSSMYAAVGGVYYAHYAQFVSPEISSLGTSIDLILMLFLGGVGTIFGPILGVTIYQIIPEITSSMEDYEMLFRGVLLLVVLLFFPGGVYRGLKKIISYSSSSSVHIKTSDHSKR